MRLALALQNRIRLKLLALEDNPRPFGSQKLRGSDYYRIRIGNYRIIYAIDDAPREVRILDIGHRKDVYKGL